MNKRGEVLPSVNHISDIWKQYQYNPPVNNRGYSHARQHPFDRGDVTLACAYGCDDDISSMNDVDFSAHNAAVRRQAAARASFLARETSLGNINIVNQESDNEKRVAALLKAGKTQWDLNLFLTQNNRWAIGDKVIYEAMQQGDPNISLGAMGVIIAIEREVEKVKWEEMHDIPKPFLVLNLQPYKWQKENPGKKPSAWHSGFHARWMNMKYQRHVTQNEYNQFFKDDVQLQDYIRQAKDALKAGLVEIQN